MSEKKHKIDMEKLAEAEKERLEAEQAEKALADAKARHESDQEIAQGVQSALLLSELFA